MGRSRIGDRGGQGRPRPLRRNESDPLRPAKAGAKPLRRLGLNEGHPLDGRTASLKPKTPVGSSEITEKEGYPGRTKPSSPKSSPSLEDRDAKIKVDVSRPSFEGRNAVELPKDEKVKTAAGKVKVGMQSIEKAPKLYERKLEKVKSKYSNTIKYASKSLILSGMVMAIGGPFAPAVAGVIIGTGLILGFALDMIAGRQKKAGIEKESQWPSIVNRKISQLAKGHFANTIKYTTKGLSTGAFIGALGGPFAPVVIAGVAVFGFAVGVGLDLKKSLSSRKAVQITGNPGLGTKAMDVANEGKEIGRTGNFVASFNGKVKNAESGLTNTIKYADKAMNFSGLFSVFGGPFSPMVTTVLVSGGLVFGFALDVAKKFNIKPLGSRIGKQMNEKFESTFKNTIKQWNESDKPGKVLKGTIVPVFGKGAGEAVKTVIQLRALVTGLFFDTARGIQSIGKSKTPEREDIEMDDLSKKGNQADSDA